MQEQALRLLFNDSKYGHAALLKKAEFDTLHLRCLKAIVLDVFKSVNNLNPSFMNEMVQLKRNSYDLRDENKLIQSNFKKIRYGKKIGTF